jgi:hypothetical protein
MGLRLCVRGQMRIMSILSFNLVLIIPMIKWTDKALSNMNTNNLPGWKQQSEFYIEQVTPIQKWGYIGLGLVGLILAFLTYQFGQPTESALFMACIIGAMSIFFIYVGYNTEQRFVDTNRRKFIWKGVFSGKILKEISFNEISMIQSVDLTSNGVYQGRYFYYVLKKDNNQAIIRQKISKNIESKVDQRIFEDSINIIIFGGA